MRYPLIIANWKLNGNQYMVKNLIAALRNKLESVVGCDIVIAPPMIYLNIAKQKLVGSRIVLGAQNVDTHLVGAYTGEVSVEMLKDIGAKYIIIGHSERRYFHQESNEDIAEKFAMLKATGLIPVLCIGESETEKKAMKTEEVCAKQIDVVLNLLGVKAFYNSVIAYEPIWAIGTGTSAIPAEVQAIHKFIRHHIYKHDSLVAQQVIIQYGGSVNVNNATEFFNHPDIDGALVGGASLKADSFAAIVKAAVKSKQEILAP